MFWFVYIMHDISVLCSKDDLTSELNIFQSLSENARRNVG
jgi:hypothetical protein